MAETATQPFPRFFTHPEGFGDDTVYVRADGSHDVIVVSVHGTFANVPIALGECEGMVANDGWKEITEVEADAMLAARKQEKPGA